MSGGSTAYFAGRIFDGERMHQRAALIVESDRVPDYRKAIRNHRKSTGDSTPRLRA